MEPDLVSEFERVHFYTGLSDNPPELLHRSDLLTNPFVIPSGRHSSIPQKTAHGVFDPILKAIWRNTIAPEIIALLKDANRGIHVSTILPVRFSTPDEDEKDVFGPIVIWISVHPNTTTAEACRDANPEILRILESHNIKDAAVHWIEGSVERMVGPAMLSVAYDTDPTHYIRRALTAVLGVPLAAEEMAADDSQGSLGIYFHEGKDKKGDKSERVLAVTNKHVVSKVTSTDYELGRDGAAKQWMYVCGSRRFQHVVNETRALIAKNLSEASRLTKQLAGLLAKQPSEGDKKALKRLQRDLKTVNEDTVILEEFFNDLNSSWSDVYQRLIGWVDWAPKIHKDVDSRCYTRDIGVFELDKAKWEKEFKGNAVYLGAFCFISLSISSNENNLQLANILPAGSKLCFIPMPPTHPLSSTPWIIYTGFRVVSRPNASRIRISSTSPGIPSSSLPSTARPPISHLDDSRSWRHTLVTSSRRSHGRLLSLTTTGGRGAFQPRATLVPASSTRRARWLRSCTLACTEGSPTTSPSALLLTSSSTKSRNTTLTLTLPASRSSKRLYDLESTFATLTVFSPCLFVSDRWFRRRASMIDSLRTFVPCNASHSVNRDGNAEEGGEGAGQSTSRFDGEGESGGGGEPQSRPSLTTRAAESVIALGCAKTLPDRRFAWRWKQR